MANSEKARIAGSRITTTKRSAAGSAALAWMRRIAAASHR